MCKRFDVVLPTILETSEQDVSQLMVRAPSPLLDLPTELHHMILQYLPYPDSASLKITHPHFHALIRPIHDVASRVTWLLSRADEGLCLPQSKRLNLKTEQAFLGNSEVQLILKQRRSHEECGQLWFKTDRKNRCKRSWLSSQSEQRCSALPQCLIDPNVRICHGIQRVRDGENVISHLEKKYSNIKGRMASRMSLDLKMSWLVLFEHLVHAVAIVSVFMLVKRLSVQLSISEICSETAFACQSIVLCTVMSLVLFELLVPNLAEPVGKFIRSIA